VIDSSCSVSGPVENVESNSYISSVTFQEAVNCKVSTFLYPVLTVVRDLCCSDGLQLKKQDRKSRPHTAHRAFPLHLVMRNAPVAGNRHQRCSEWELVSWLSLF